MPEFLGLSGGPMPKAGSTGISPKFLFVLRMSFSFTYKAPKISENQTPEDSLEGNPDSRARMDGCSGSPSTVGRLLDLGVARTIPKMASILSLPGPLCGHQQIVEHLGPNVWFL